MKNSLTKFALRELKTIHDYSKKYNKLKGKNHARILLQLMEDHIDEISQRHKNMDSHYLIETGDLLILCFELLKEARRSPDVILSMCYKRYHKKFDNFLEIT